MNRPASRGFTLVELLVVIGIIGILMGLLLPAIQHVRQNARSANCQSNMRQLLIAVHLFEQETGALPDIDGAGNTSGRLIELLRDRVDNFRVFHCPAHQGRDGEEHNNAATSQSTCYQYNDSAFLRQNGVGPAYKSLDDPTIITTSLVLLIDTLDGAPRHFGGSNVGFADGHVEWMVQARYNGPDPVNGGAGPWSNWGRK